MLKYLKGFRERKNIIVQTKKQDYKVTKLTTNRFKDGKEEIHFKVIGSPEAKEGEEIVGVIGLYNFKLIKNKMINKLDFLFGKHNTLSVYVIFTSYEDGLVIILKPLPKEVTNVADLLEEVKSHYSGEVKLNGNLINPRLTDEIVNSSDLSYEELTNNIKITGY